MFRSTTPELIFKVKNTDINVADIAICHITVESADHTHSILYENPTIDAENKTITQYMTQAETLSFNPGSVLIQLKAKLNSGAVICSDIIVKNMKDILEEAEL